MNRCSKTCSVTRLIALLVKLRVQLLARLRVGLMVALLAALQAPPAMAQRAFFAPSNKDGKLLLSLGMGQESFREAGGVADGYHALGLLSRFAWVQPRLIASAGWRLEIEVNLALAVLDSSGLVTRPQFHRSTTQFFIPFSTSKTLQLGAEIGFNLGGLIGTRDQYGYPLWIGPSAAVYVDHDTFGFYRLGYTFTGLVGNLSGSDLELEGRVSIPVFKRDELRLWVDIGLRGTFIADFEQASAFLALTYQPGR